MQINAREQPKKKTEEKKHKTTKCALAKWKESQDAVSTNSNK